MICRDCHRFDQETSKCLDQKVNPPTYSQAVEVANVIGLRSICAYNDFRERLVSARKSEDAFRS
jgi:hypothetical protein